MSSVWFLIPARGGSKAIPQKNLRLLNGKPLVSHVLDTINSITRKDRIIISTDSEEIRSITDGRAIIHNRSTIGAGDKATLDDVALEVCDYLLKNGQATPNDILVTVQPTSPFLQSNTLKRAIAKFDDPDTDTVLTVVDDRHLRWTIREGNPKPLYTKRVNRQEMEPIYSETGGIIASRINSLLENKTRIGEKIALIEIDEKEGLDIDSYEDWARAEFWSNRIRVFIRVDGSKKMGFGHLYRALALAQNLTAHEVFFITLNNGEYKIGKDFLSSHNFPLLEISEQEDLFRLIDKYHPQILINDILDTEKEYVEKIKEKGLFIVNFEDLGSGTLKADVVVNDLYPDIYPQKDHWYGIENAILNPNFEIERPKAEPSGEVEHILIAYGGTDPSNLTVKAIKGLKHIDYKKKVTIILGPANSMRDAIEEELYGLKASVTLLQDVKNMAKVMKQADLALTSAGRTVTELMCLGIPTIAICQNMKEMRHNHATGSYGVINLGLGSSIGPEVLAEHIKIYINDLNMRRDMYRRMISATNGRSNASIVERIISAYKKTKGMV